MSDSNSRDKQQSCARPTSASGQVLRLAEFDRSHPQRLMLELREYWHSLRQGRAVPARSDIEPSGIRRVLDYAFILERIAPGAARFRLAGQHLIDLMGMEVRGMPAVSFLKPPSRGRFADVLESVFKAPQIAELTLDAPGEYARPALRGHMLLLPLRSDLGDITRALGCLISEGEIGIGPRRFDLIEDRVRPIIAGGKTLRPSPSSYELAESQREFRRPDSATGAPMQTSARQADIRNLQNASPEQRRAAFRIISTDGG